MQKAFEFQFFISKVPTFPVENKLMVVGFNSS